MDSGQLSAVGTQSDYAIFRLLGSHRLPLRTLSVLANIYSRYYRVGPIKGCVTHGSECSTEHCIGDELTESYHTARSSKFDTQSCNTDSSPRSDEDVDASSIASDPDGSDRDVDSFTAAAYAQATDDKDEEQCESFIACGYKNTQHRLDEATAAGNQANIIIARWQTAHNHFHMIEAAFCHAARCNAESQKDEYGVRTWGHDGGTEHMRRGVRIHIPRSNSVQPVSIERLHPSASWHRLMNQLEISKSHKALAEHSFQEAGITVKKVNGRSGPYMNVYGGYTVRPSEICSNVVSLKIDSLFEHNSLTYEFPTISRRWLRDASQLTRCSHTVVELQILARQTI
jgi:hypothetical protein